ncbi:MAG: NAD(P)H-hydrate dehydratase [Bacteroidales bacterium]|nr:NAD(P)H-hydrate dehydratase [Bacteroidales bacterium]
MNNYILTRNQIRESEKITMLEEPITSLDLMERAGTVMAQHILQKKATLHHPTELYLIFCGHGNNGGDGLVIARKLHEAGEKIIVVTVMEENSRCTEEFATNLQRLKQQETLPITDFRTFSQHPLTDFCGNDELRIAVIDALFGIGLSRPASGIQAEAIRYINQLHVPVWAVDVPSGLMTDNHTPDNSPRVHATTTCTFQWMKWAYVLPENGPYVGAVHVLDIGLKLPAPLKDDVSAGTTALTRHAELTDAGWAAHALKLPQKFAHKGSNGHGLLIAGSKKMPGAAVLAAGAALRGGIGKLTVHTTSNAADALSIARPEAIIDRDRNEEYNTVFAWEDLPAFQALAIGPGLGTAAGTAALLKNCLSEIPVPMVMDADALNLLVQNKTLLSYLPTRTILTPHIGEFDRIAGKPANDFDRIQRLVKTATQYGVIIVLKGAHTITALSDGQLFVNTTGNPGMATAGSGDVLTGLTLALLAQGYTPETTARLAPYLHGLAGDLALNEQSTESLIASDIIDHLGAAFSHLRNHIIDHQ